MKQARADLSPRIIDNGGYTPEATCGPDGRWGFTADLTADRQGVAVQVYDPSAPVSLGQWERFYYRDGDAHDCDRVVHEIAAFIGA